MQTIQQKIPEIQGAKLNGKKTNLGKVSENLGIACEVALFLEILENTVPFTTGSCQKIQMENNG